MIATIVITTILPQTELGIKIANEMEQNCIQRGCFPSRKETTQTITITESHTITMNEVGENARNV